MAKIINLLCSGLSLDQSRIVMKSNTGIREENNGTMARNGLRALCPSTPLHLGLGI